MTLKSLNDGVLMVDNLLSYGMCPSFMAHDDLAVKNLMYKLQSKFEVWGDFIYVQMFVLLST